MTNANPYFQFPYDHFRLARLNTNIVTIFFSTKLAAHNLRKEMNYSENVTVAAATVNQRDNK